MASETVRSGTNEPSLEQAPPVWVVLFLAVVLAGLAFALESHISLDLNDEGFLWYGTIETSNGSVPVRDFQSYEPGRYYWGTVFFWLLHDQGIVTLRLAMAAFEAIGLACGLLVARRILPSLPLLAITAVALALWVEPRFRVYEFTITLLCVFMSVRLLERPSVGRYVAMGVFVGLSAFFGRNHGLYTLVASLLISVIAVPFEESRGSRRVLALLKGIALGATPLLFMVVFVPGFGRAFIDLVDINVQSGISLSRDLVVPGITVPWPATPWALPKHFAFGLTLIALPLAYAVGALRLLGSARTPRWNVIASSAITGSVYLHHIYARPDKMHLASAIAPFVILLLTFGPTRPSWLRDCGVLLILVAELHLSFDVIVKHTPLYQFKEFANKFDKIRVRGEHLFVPVGEAVLIRALKDVKGEVGRDDDFLIVPNMPGLYPVLHKKAPLWRLLFELPETSARQSEMIAILERKRVAWAIVCGFNWDGHEDLSLARAYPLLSGYLRSWERSPLHLPDNCGLLERPDDAR